MSRDNKSYNQLFITVIDNSESKNWEEAVLEWEDHDLVEDDGLRESCICGQPNLRYQYTIKNKLNGNTLFAIGSECINKFRNEDIKSSAKIRKDLLLLSNAFKDNQYISIDDKRFTKKILVKLYELGAFESNDGYYDPESSYSIFYTARFKPKTCSPAQKKAATAILLNNLRPFLNNYNE